MSGHPVVFDHLEALSDGRGLFEHAAGTVPRLDHGYCTDDNARLLVVTSRGFEVGAPTRLHGVALAFTLASVATDGKVRNRMDRHGRWTDPPSTDDCWGRCIWGLGTSAAMHPDPDVQAACLAAVERALQARSRWSRAMAFAALGAAEVLTSVTDHRPSRQLLADALVAIGPVDPGRWVWPEPSLRYANAALAEATIVAGSALGDDRALDRGLAMLGWLLDRETRHGHLSVTSTAGSSEHDPPPAFDQQPIEVAALADACWRAAELTGDSSWWRGVAAADAWFDGSNDAGLAVVDVASGGSFDGLHADAVNLNQGAESTLALVSVRQRSQAPVRAW